MITAASNSRLKKLIRLNQKAKARREEDVFLAEGVKMFLEAPAEKIREVYIAESFAPDGPCREKLLQTGCEVVADSLFSRISDERQQDVLERFSLELSHSNNPKGWYELDYPYRMKSELISFGNVLESVLQKCYGRDITWLNRELKSRYDMRVPSEVAGIADRELFRRPIRQASAGLSDMTKVRAVSRLGAGVVAMGSIALSVVPMAQVPAMALRGLSLCITPMAEVALGKATDHQRHILEGTLERDVPKIYARCVSSVEESVRSVYLSTCAELEGACASWAEAGASACEAAGETPEPERERERLAGVISELDAIIEGR